MKRGMEFIRLLTEFFDSYLPDTKGVSENTIRSYKAALRIFFIFLEEEKGIRQAVGRIEIQAPDVDGLTYLEDAQDVQPGDMIPVRIAQGFAYDLVAERMD